MARRVINRESVFGWCADGHHDQCTRQFNRFYFEGKRLVQTEDVVMCACEKRGCKCNGQKAVKKVESTKPL